MFCHRKVEEVFKPSKPVVVLYLEERFQQWIDVDDGYIPTNKEKLQVVNL